MAVSRRKQVVSSFDDISLLFNPKETIMSENQISQPNQAAPGENDMNVLFNQAMQDLRTIREELGRQTSETLAKADTALTTAQELLTKVSDQTNTADDRVKEINGRINDLEKAAAKAATAGSHATKQPVYKRTLDVMQQIGGLTAFVGGIAYGGVFLYDQLKQSQDTAS